MARDAGGASGGNKIAKAAPKKPQPKVAQVVTPPVTSLRAINEVPKPAPIQTSLQPANQPVLSPAYVSPTLAAALGVAGASSAKGNQFAGVTGSASVTPTQTIGGGTSYNPTGNTYSLGGEQLYLSPSESKSAELYQPPQTAGNVLGVAGAGALNQPGAGMPATGSAVIQPNLSPTGVINAAPARAAGTQPGSFTGSEPKAAQYYEPPSVLPPGWNGVPKGITMADYGAYQRYMDVFNSGGLMGQVTPNMIAVSQGQLSDQNLASMGYQRGADGSWYLVGGGGSSGGGGGGGGGGSSGGGGGGYSQSRSGYGYGASDLLNWRIGT